VTGPKLDICLRSRGAVLRRWCEFSSGFVDKASSRGSQGPRRDAADGLVDLYLELAFLDPQVRCAAFFSSISACTSRTGLRCVDGLAQRLGVCSASKRARSLSLYASARRVLGEHVES